MCTYFSRSVHSTLLGGGIIRGGWAPFAKLGFGDRWVDFGSILAAFWRLFGGFLVAFWWLFGSFLGFLVTFWWRFGGSLGWITTLVVFW